MAENEIISPLFLITLVGVLIIAALVFARFMRKRSNRHPMDTPEGQDAEDMRRRDAERQRERDNRPDLS